MITRHRVPVRSRLLATGAVMAFVVASCGGDNSDDASGATAESWCALADESGVLDDVFESLGDDPSQAEAGLKRVEEFVQKLPGAAPAEIADDVKLLAESTELLIDAIADADYQILDADLSILSDTEMEALRDAASDDVDAYTERECGRSFGDDTDSDTAPADGDGDLTDDSDDSDSDVFDPANGTLREQLVTQFEALGLSSSEASCIADNLDFSDPTIQSGDIGAMLGVFEECDISLERLAELGG